MCDNEILAVGMLCPESEKVHGRELVGAPFAFDSVGLAGTLAHDEIDFVAALVTPVVDVSGLQAAM